MSAGTAEDAAHLDRAAGPFRLSRPLSVFVAQRDRWALWSPVLFATGIALYFALTVEPGIETGAIASGVCLVALGFAWRAPGWRLVFIAALLIAAGFAVAQGRTHAVAAPVLARDFGPGGVTGRVVAVDTLPGGSRVLLDRLQLQGLAPSGTPAQVRVRLRRGDDASVGETIRLRARLSPPSPPAMPGAFDFQRHAWFARIGGIWLCLWRGPVRWAGVAGVLAGLASVALSAPPDILIGGDGRLVAVRRADGGLSLSSVRVEAFTARIWLQRNGDPEGSATAWPETESPDGRLRCDALGCLYRAAGRTVALVRDERAFVEDCAPGAVVVSTVPARWHCRAADRVVDRFDLWRNGAHALWLRDGGGVEVVSVRQARGDRLWTRAPPDRGRRAKPGKIRKATSVSIAASGRRGGPEP